MAKYNAAQVIEALKGSGGVISTAADRLGCTWHTVKRYIDNYPTVREAYEAESQRVTDKARSNVVGAIVTDKDLALSKWWLQVKDPEFKPKQEIDNTGTQEIIVKYDRSQPVHPPSKTADS